MGMENRIDGLPQGDLDCRPPTRTAQSTSTTGPEELGTPMGHSSSRKRWPNWTSLRAALRSTTQDRQGVYERLPEYVQKGQESHQQGRHQDQREGQQQQQWKWALPILHGLGTGGVPNCLYGYQLMVILLVLLVPLIQDCHAAPFSSHPVTVCQELARFRPGSYLKFLAERIRCVQDHKTKPRIQFDLEERLSRPRRFVTKVQINLCIWTWISNLFQEYKEVGKALTPLENNTWMANTVLQAAQLVHRKKREVEPEVQVSRMMHWLQTPLLHNQTILTPVKREPEAHDFDLESRT